jgi:hypothetical protein
VDELGGNLPDGAEIAHSEGFSYGRKGAGVEDNKIEGPVTPQDAPNVEIFEVFELGVIFTSIPVTHEIGAAGDVKISHIVLGTLDKGGERTFVPVVQIRVQCDGTQIWCNGRCDLHKLLVFVHRRLSGCNLCST